MMDRIFNTPADSKGSEAISKRQVPASVKGGEQSDAAEDFRSIFSKMEDQDNEKSQSGSQKEKINSGSGHPEKEHAESEVSQSGESDPAKKEDADESMSESMMMAEGMKQPDQVKADGSVTTDKAVLNPNSVDDVGSEKLVISTAKLSDTKQADSEGNKAGNVLNSNAGKQAKTLLTHRITQEGSNSEAASENTSVSSGSGKKTEAGATAAYAGLAEKTVSTGSISSLKSGNKVLETASTTDKPVIEQTKVITEDPATGEKAVTNEQAKAGAQLPAGNSEEKIQGRSALKMFRNKAGKPAEMIRNSSSAVTENETNKAESIKTNVQADPIISADKATMMSAGASAQVVNGDPNSEKGSNKKGAGASSKVLMQESDETGRLNPEQEKRIPLARNSERDLPLSFKENSDPVSEFADTAKQDLSEDFPEMDLTLLKSEEEAENPEIQRGTVNRLAQMPVNNSMLRRELLPGISKIVQGARSQGASQQWQNHHFELGDGNKIKISTRNVDGVLQVKLASANTEITKLMQQYSDEIRETLEQEYDLKVDLQFEGSGTDGSRDFEGMFSKRTGNNRQPGGNPESKAVVNQNSPLKESIRRFGYNSMEWTA